MKYSVRWSWAVFAAGVVLGSYAANATAAEKSVAASADDTPALDEIVVTAQRREERLQDVPVAISVTTAEQIERDQIRSLNDLQRISAAVEVNRTFGGETNGGGRIRGLGTTSFSGVGAVAFVIDGVPQGDVAQVNIFDIGQIEVLRGPQGTLFGQTASAGVINQTTVAPDPDKIAASVRLEASYKGTLGSEFGRQSVHAALNVPLGGTSAIRVASFATRTVGSQHNTYNNQDSEFNDVGVRVRYLVRPSDNLEVNLIGDFASGTQYGPDFFTAAVAPAASSPEAALLAACGIKPGFGNQDYCYPSMSDARSRNYGLSAKLDYIFNGLTFTSVTAWRQAWSGNDRNVITRLIGNIPDIYSLNSFDDRNQIVQELRLTSPSGEKVEYVAGLYYSRSFHRPGVGPQGGGFNLIFPWPNGAPPCVFGGACSIVNSFTPNSQQSTSKSGFGDVTVRVTDALRVFGGLRYTRQELDNTIAATSGSRADRNVSGRLGLAYKADRDHMFYGSVATGYKSPYLQVNANPLVAPLFIKAEKPLAVEMGYKGSFLDNRLAVDVNVFHVDVKDFQGQQCTISAQNGALNCSSVNIPSVVSKGLELDVLGNPYKGVRLNGGLIYNPVTYPSNFRGSDTTHNGIYNDISGQQLALAPKYKMTLSAEFSHAMGGGDSEGYLSVNPVWKAKTRFNDSTNPVYDYKAHWQLGATLGLRSQNGRWNVSLFGRNITGEHEPVVIFGTDNGGALQGWPFADVTLKQLGVSFEARL
jgi:iron complex outermembrane receptor protein